MEFLPLSRRRSSARDVPSGEERGDMDVFAGYIPPKRVQSPPKIIKSRPCRYLTDFRMQDFRKLGMGIKIIVKGVF